MQQYTTMFSELWVQEFAKKGGGHHSAHIHWNQHVSGFYFLKCSDKTSYPVFHEPKTGARCTKLKMKPCLLYTSPSPRDRTRSRMPSSA